MFLLQPTGPFFSEPKSKYKSSVSISYVYTRHRTGGHAPNERQLSRDGHAIAFTRRVAFLLYSLQTMVTPIINGGTRIYAETSSVALQKQEYIANV